MVKCLHMNQYISLYVIMMSTTYQTGAVLLACALVLAVISRSTSGKESCTQQYDISALPY